MAQSGTALALSLQRAACSRKGFSVQIRVAAFLLFLGGMMFDYFAKEKSDFLKKKDKSKKGSVDKDAAGLVNEINSKNDYYTTSSCSGRIVLLEMEHRKKNECSWIFAKHDEVNFKEIFESLNSHKNKNEVWFNQQPLILHVACRNLDSARIFLGIARKIFRRAGIIALSSKKVVLEIIGDERLETIVADEKFVADEKYLKELVKYANRNFADNKKKIGRFLKILIKL